MKYPLTMRLLHWIMAILIFGQLAAGLWMVRMPDEFAPKFELFYPWHKSFGLLVLLLVLIRLAVRFRSAVPELPASLRGWEKSSAKAGHVLLYLLILAIPVVGYSMSSTYTMSDGVTFFGIPVPELLPKNDAQFEVFQRLHRLGGYALLAVVFVHVLAVAKHRLEARRPGGQKDLDVLSRML
jgi:cytochrome b561